MWHGVDWRDLPIALQKPSGDGLHQPACIAPNVPASITHRQMHCFSFFVVVFIGNVTWKSSCSYQSFSPTFTAGKLKGRFSTQPNHCLGSVRFSQCPKDLKSHWPTEKWFSEHLSALSMANAVTVLGWSSFRQCRAVLIPSCSICYFSSE